MRPYPTISRRFWAGVFDGLIIYAVQLLGRLLLDSYDSTALYVFWVIFINLFAVLYSVLLHGFYGQTLGKMLLKIKVVDVSEKSDISMKQAVFRENFYLIAVLIFIPLTIYTILSGNEASWISDTLRILSNASLIWFLIEIFSCLTNEKARALHDFIAGTVVVKAK